MQCQGCEERAELKELQEDSHKFKMSVTKALTYCFVEASLKSLLSPKCIPCNFECFSDFYFDVLFREKSYESQTEEESSQSAEASNLSPTQANVFKEVDSTESTDEEEEKEEQEQEQKHDITEKHIISTEKVLSENESVSRLPAADVQPEELSGTEEEEDPAITKFDQVVKAANEKDSSSVPDRDIPQSELEPTDLLSFRGISHVDVCALELETAEDKGGDKQETAVVDKEIVEKTEVEEPVEVFPYSGLSDVDVCATELEGTKRTMEGATAEDETDVVEQTNPQPEETFVQSSFPSESLESYQQEAEDQAEKTKDEEETRPGASSGGIDESLTHIEGGLDSNAIPKEDSLVEISFEDVPEAQQINEVWEKQPEEEASVVLQTNVLEMQQEEESKEVTAVATYQNISGTQEHNETEMTGVEKEVNPEGEEMEGQHEEYDIKKKVDANDSNLTDSDDDHDDDEKGEGVKYINSSYQPTTEAEEENPEDETDHKNEDNGKISEGEFHQIEDSEKETNSNDLDFQEDETTDTVGGDKEDINTEGYSEVEDQQMNDGGAENLSSQVTQSNVPTAAMEAESETLEASAQHQPKENEESQRTLVESQQEEKEVTSKERTSEAEHVEDGKIESEIQEKSVAMCEEGSISPIQSADWPAADHQGDERPLGSEKDTTEPKSNSGGKVKFDASSQYRIYISVTHRISHIFLCLNIID